MDNCFGIKYAFDLHFRRKNLAVHLGLDDKVGIREVQKINTYCLPVPATTFDEVPEAAAAVAREVEVVTDDVKVCGELLQLI